MSNRAIDSSYDDEYLTYLPGRTYMAGVSPWFFTVSLIFSTIFYLLIIILVDRSITPRKRTTKISSTEATTGFSLLDGRI